MKETRNGNQFNQKPPSEIRSTVTSRNQIYIPPFLVEKIGFEDKKISATSAVVSWYYHKKDDKAVLSNDGIDRPSLELVTASALSGISHEELKSGVEDGAKVTIHSELPNHLHKMLTQTGQEIVLKPIYASEHPKLESTCVSVYPGAEYDSGELPNVDSEVRVVSNETRTSSNKKTEIRKYDNHGNSV